MNLLCLFRSCQNAIDTVVFFKLLRLVELMFRELATIASAPLRNPLAQCRHRRLWFACNKSGGQVVLWM
jgi:hypothetical protein